MNFDFTINAYVFARFGVPNVYLHRALSGYTLQLHVPIAIEPKREEVPHVVIDHRLALSIQVEAQQRLIGKAEPDSRVWLTPHTYTNSYSCGYSMALSREQLVAIEIARMSMSSPMQFHFRLEVVALDVEQHLTTPGQHSGSMFPVPTEHWLSQLRNCGFANKTIFEIDLPIDAKQVVDASPGGYLKSAQAAFLNGQFAQCATQCRIALETLTKNLGDEAEISALGGNRTEREALGAKDRIRILRRELSRVASVSAHTPPSGSLSDFELTRSEAALILASTAGVLATATSPRA